MATVSRAEAARVRAYIAGGHVEPEDADLYSRLRERWDELAALAPTDIAAHAQLLHRTDKGVPITFPRHMQVWAYLAQQAEKYRWLCLVAPTSYAKTTFWSQIYPAWEIGKDPRLRFGLISGSAGLAYENSKAVQEVVTQPLYRTTYGPSTAASYAHDGGWGWAQDQWYLKGSQGPPHATMRAMGMDGQIQGRRFDRIVVDDPTSWDQARSKTTMETQRAKLLNTIITRLPAGQRPPENRPDMDARMVVVLTRQAVEDLVPTLEDIGFKVVTMPAMGYWDATKDPVTGEWVWGEEPLWPAVEDHAQLLRLQVAFGTQFELAWQGDAKAGTGSTMFDPDTFQHGRCPYHTMGTSTTAWVDTSSGKSRERGDYFAMVTMGQNQTRDVPGTENWVVSVRRGRINTLAQEEAVEQEAVMLHRMGAPISGIYIATTNEGGAGLYQRLVAKTRLPLLEGSEREDKEFRATPLAGAYRARFVWHDDAVWRKPYEAELERFPGGAHDDQVDCASGAYNRMETGAGGMRVLRSRRARR